MKSTLTAAFPLAFSSSEAVEGAENNNLSGYKTHERYRPAVGFDWKPGPLNEPFGKAKRGFPRSRLNDALPGSRSPASARPPRWAEKRSFASSTAFIADASGAVIRNASRTRRSTTR